MINIIKIGVLLLTSAHLLFSAESSAGSWQQNVNIGGFSSVNIYTPDSDSVIGDGKSLLIVLHGCVQPINNYLTAKLEDAAEEHGMVIAVPDAKNKAGFSCWSYWQGAISRNSGDYKNLISLANTLSLEPQRSIDPQQVYIAGLSSGGAFAQQAACVAPDIFAGVAPSAGPTLGTSSNGALNTCEVVAPSTFKSRCESYAGSYASHLETQIAVIGHGTADTTVDTCYNQQNANGFANVYGVSPLAGSNSISDDSSRTATESLWTDNRVAMLWFDGLDHSWSGGEGASGSYIDDSSINFARYLGRFFSENNQRVSRNTGPVINNLIVSDNSSRLSISGNATDAEGSVSNVSIDIFALDTGSSVLMETITVSSVPSDGYFNVNSSILMDGLYLVKVQGADNESKQGDSASSTVRVGPEPAATAPALSGIAVDVVGQCAAVSGTVIDINQNLLSVTAVFSNATNTATVENNQFFVEQCNLSGGSNSVTLTALDSTSLSTSATASFTIDAGQTGDYNYHINEGHITWGSGYSSCYLAFSTNEFTMREYPAGTAQCNWIADAEPSCKGPTQACSTPSAPVDSDNDGISDSTDNCPNLANSQQLDNDGDGIGNVCDSTPDGNVLDADNDGIYDDIDNCPNAVNSDQLDNDGDGVGNVCDPTPNGDFTCIDYTDSNYAHVSAGRATASFGVAYAKGSNDYLGWWNIYVTTTVKQTSSGYFELGSCPAN